ncbi:uncharacterized protein MKK02DRAFT_44226 [Dioszegia hungarica]|uniref:Uncharacterized protein n=1 Tax=Dioszegia hungarica TaxID=4972 RepID=A0AA38LVN0_9TREE|nr:uncharacterized protein MKK02DRAFT_44226 [Dioszegia hungarica]KAI9635536.1 hypothetical protein MKK02DRAFT_44226 [Dioszegia hungarica]
MPSLSKVWSFSAPTRVPLAVFPTFNEDNTPTIGADGYPIFAKYTVIGESVGSQMRLRALAVKGKSKSQWWTGSHPAWQVAFENTKPSDDGFTAKSEPSYSTKEGAPFALIVGTEPRAEVERIVRGLLKGRMKSKHTLDERDKDVISGQQWLCVASNLETSRQLDRLVRACQEKKRCLTEQSDSGVLGTRDVDDDDDEVEDETEGGGNGEGPSSERRVTFG